MVEDNLWAVNVRPEEALREYALMVLKFKTVYRAVFENRLVRYFLRFVPSVAELVMLGKVLFHVKETSPGGGPRYDVVVMDAPATGHAISFLSGPPGAAGHGGHRARSGPRPSGCATSWWTPRPPPRSWSRSRRRCR